MKKSLFIFILLFTFVSQLQAEVLNVSYKVSFGIVGEVGIADARLEKTDNRYTIDIGIKATGMAASLSRNRKERHISKGHIINGMLVTDTYQVKRSYGEKIINKIYHIDHKKRKITKDYVRTKNGKTTKNEHSTLDFYSKDDLLTLYFNLPFMIKDKTKSGVYKFPTVGAERQNGEVKIYIPKKSELKEYKQTLGEGDYWYITSIIFQKIFTSNKGELMLAIGKDGVASKAVLKDLVVSGDLTAERIK